MPPPVQCIQTCNLNQLRQILQQMSIQNQGTIQSQLIQHLEDEHQTVRRLSQICHEELVRKQQNLQNVIRFALYVLNELQVKIEQNTTAENQIWSLQNDFSKLLAYNQQLLTRFQDIQNQNNHFKQKIQQAQTYISEVSNSKTNNEANLDNPMSIQLRNLGISNLPYKHSHLTQRPSMSCDQNNFISMEQYTETVSTLEQGLQRKILHICQLQRQISCLNSKVSLLQNDFQLKSSQLQLSQLYFRQKIDIISQSVANKSRQVHCSISEHQMNSVFRREMSRVSSVQSINSNVINSQISQQQSQFNNYQSQIQCIDQLGRNDIQRHERRQCVRRSLMQEFVSDLVMESKGNLFESNDNSKGQNSDITTDKCSDSKKSVAFSKDFKSTSTKTTQTNFHGHKSKLLTRRNQGSKKTYQQRNNLDQTSFFSSFSTITSLFAKKPRKSPQECAHTQNILESSFPNQLNKQTQFVLPFHSLHQQQPSTSNSTIANLFRGIFQYATKKIVIDRIHHKKRKGNSLLDQSAILDEKKDSKVNKKVNFVKNYTNY